MSDYYSEEPLEYVPHLSTICFARRTELVMHSMEMLPPADEEEEDAPRFDLADVPEHIRAEDPVEQGEILRAVMNERLSNIGGGISYHTLPIKRVYLSELRNNFRSNQGEKAMMMMKQRSELRIDADMKVDPESDDALYQFPGNYLDYKLVTSNAMGLGAALPLRIPSTTYEMRINPSQGREFRAKYGYMSWSTERSMFYLGECPHGEMWLGMRPNTDNDGQDEEEMEEFSLTEMKGSTQLKTDHWKMMYMFIVHCISLIPGSPVTVMARYGPHGSDDMTWNPRDQSTLG